MLKIVNNDIMRGSHKIGWYEGDRFFNEDGKKVGYVKGEYVFDDDGRRVAYVDDHELKTYDGRKMDLDDLIDSVQGGTISDLHRAAIRLLLGGK